MKDFFKKIHFVGIGGIGTSSLAQFFLKKGHIVSGSDIKKSEITEFLEKKGVKIFLGHKKENLPEGKFSLIYSLACKKNIEVLEAKKRKAKVFSFPEALGVLTKKYFSICVSGTHGKSTTTALISLGLIRAKKDPTCIIGTKLKEFKNSNFRLGKSKILVLEADEYENAFLNYHPNVIVITNIEKEHLDFFKNEKNIIESFKKFGLNLKKNGFIVVNEDQKNSKKVGEWLKKKGKKVIFASLKEEISNLIKKFLKIPGKHNLSNALLAWKVLKKLGVKKEVILKTFFEYKGAWRRMEIIKKRPFILISDYAHHPTEIKATINALKEKFPKKRFVLIFQPHQYERTKLLFDDFVKSFNEVDILVLTEIFEVKGRETKKDISAKDLKGALQSFWQKTGKKGKVFFVEKENLEDFLKKILQKKDLVVLMGAGDIDEKRKALKKIKI